MRARFLNVFLLVTTLAVCRTACGEDCFLTIGGGYNAHGNQVSLEKNAQLFQRMLEESYGEECRHDVFFSDGRAPGRDVQFVDSSREVPPALRLLAELHNQAGDIDYRYRNHEVANISGPAGRPGLQKWFNETGSALAEGDRLFIYVTGHGGRSTDKEKPHDTILYLWNRQPLRVHDFTAMLNNVSPDVPVVLVMVQCFSGGFAHAIFEEGNAENGLAPRRRCGFFATVHNRVAAGCTPDINEANYHEYSTYFFEALRGKTRFDELLARPDYDGDGRTSLAEAHASVILSSVTIDIPICTSDAFLREFSRTKPEEEEKPSEYSENDDVAAATEGEAPVQDVGDQLSTEEPVLLTADSPYDVLIAEADPVDRAVIDGLSEQLGVSGQNRAAATRAKAGEFQKRKNELNKERKKLQGEYNGIREQTKRRVFAKWPELTSRWHPVTVEVLAEHADELVELIESAPKYDRFVELREKLDELDEAKFDQERQWVKSQRLLGALETVALAANLPRVAAPDVVDQFAELRAAERALFGPVDDAAVVTSVE